MAIIQCEGPSYPSAIHSKPTTRCITKKHIYSINKGIKNKITISYYYVPLGHDKLNDPTFRFDTGIVVYLEHPPQSTMGNITLCYCLTSTSNYR